MVVFLTMSITCRRALLSVIRRDMVPMVGVSIKLNPIKISEVLLSSFSSISICLKALRKMMLLELLVSRKFFLPRYRYIYGDDYNIIMRNLDSLHFFGKEDDLLTFKLL